MSLALMHAGKSAPGDPIKAAIKAKTLAYWKLTSGLTDSGPNSYTLTNNNGVTFGANGADFTAASSHWLSRASNSDLQIGNNNRLFDFWFNADALNSVIFCKEDNSNRSYELYLNGSGVLGWYCYQGSYTNINWGSNLSTGTLYYVQVWHDADNDEIGISVNGGTAVTTAFSSSGVATNARPLQIGRFDGGTPFHFDGRIRDFGVYNALMDAEQTAWRYNGGTPRSLY